MDEASRESITFSVETASQAPYGETLPLTLVLKNLGEETLRFYRGPSSPRLRGFGIQRFRGMELVVRQDRQLPLDIETLEPGETLELSGEWEQVDNQGNPVPAGEYLVRGVLFLEPPEKLVTSAHRVEVLPDAGTR